ncbi:aminotransferase class V [Streptomyces mashuensis]|uniref:Aminotransferase class V n=1 Tax=Streptomyces mashuensis TaxID=33904 RepID=A0A919AX38_9ACTN|nr:aminotransferase class V-fold PLP-dependent enzyme [Streptomyces mashuensis]GHF30671.1 aminotransferase class V [Streptomyces mashuensis]
MDIAALRRGTPGCAHRTHLNNAGAALLSHRTLRTMTAHLELEARIGGYEAANERLPEIREVYDAVAALLGGRADEVALFDNATHAWQAAFLAVPLGPGDRILTGRSEYGSNLLGFVHAARRTGAEVVVVPDDEHGQIDTTALAGLLDERTKLVGVAHVPTDGGLVNPVAEVGRLTRRAGVPFLLDATQSVGQFPVDVEETGCDMLVGTGRKFLRGPRGIGFLWVRTGILDRLDPYVCETASAQWDGGLGFRWRDGATRFATWEMNYAAVLGLGSAVRQALDLGQDAIGERALALGTALRERLDALPGVRTHDRGLTRCAIVTAEVEGMAAAEVKSLLGRQGINVTVTHGEDGPRFDEKDPGFPSLVRLSPHYYNTEEELDRAADALAELARRAQPR